MPLPRPKTCSFKVLPGLAALLVLAGFGLNTPSSSAQSFTDPITLTASSPLTMNQQSTQNYLNNISNSSFGGPYQSFLSTLQSLSFSNGPAYSAALDSINPQYFSQQLTNMRTFSNNNQRNMRNMMRGMTRPGMSFTGLGGGAATPGGGPLADLSTPEANPNVRTVAYVDGVVPMNGYNDPQFTDPANCLPGKEQTEAPLVYGFNGTGMGSFTKQFSAEAPAFRTTTGTGLIGAAYTAAEVLTLGFTGGYSRSHLSSALLVPPVAVGFGADVSSYIGVGYLTYTPVAPVAFTVSAGYSHDQIDNRIGAIIGPAGVPTAAMPRVTTLFHGSQSGNDLLASAGVNLYLPLGDLFVHPSFYMNYTYMSQNGFIEQGTALANGVPLAPGLLNQAVDPENSYSLQSSVALDLGYIIKMGDMQIIPLASLSYSHEFAPVDDSTGSSFLAAPIPFPGNQTGGSSVLGRDYFGCGGGVFIIVNRNLSLFGNYGYQYDTHQYSHTGTGGFALTW